jgi:NAD(P)-dependent dehydrogenase (short-subunit alcohol dehydrogenase family)
MSIMGIRTPSLRSLPRPMDVTNEASVIAAYQATAARFGGADIIVSNAGIDSAASVEETHPRRAIKSLVAWTARRIPESSSRPMFAIVHTNIHEKRKFVACIPLR